MMVQMGAPKGALAVPSTSKPPTASQRAHGGPGLGLRLGVWARPLTWQCAAHGPCGWLACMCSVMRSLNPRGVVLDSCWPHAHAPSMACCRARRGGRKAWRRRRGPCLELCVLLRQPCAQDACVPGPAVGQAGTPGGAAGRTRACARIDHASVPSPGAGPRRIPEAPASHQVVRPRLGGGACGMVGQADARCRALLPGHDLQPDGRGAQLHAQGHLLRCAGAGGEGRGMQAGGAGSSAKGLAPSLASPRPHPTDTAQPA